MPLQDGRIVAAPDDQRRLFFVFDDELDPWPELWPLDFEASRLTVNGMFHSLQEAGWDYDAGTPKRTGEGIVYVLKPDKDRPTPWLKPSQIVDLYVDFQWGDWGDNDDRGVPDEHRTLTIFTDPADAISGVIDAIGDGGEAILRRLPGGVRDAGSDLGALRRAAEDLIGFPLGITGADGGTTGSGPVAPGGQALVDAEMRRVLGRKPSPDDVKGTLALLDRAMRESVQDGVRRMELVPGGATVMQADNGAGITGRQASVAGLAADTIEQITPLIGKVSALAIRTENPSLVEAARKNFLSSATEAANEAGVPGGPLKMKAAVLLNQSLDELAEFGLRLGVLKKVEYEVIQQQGKPDDLVRLNPHDDKANKKIVVRYRPDRHNVVGPPDEEQYTTFLIALDRWTVFDESFRRYLGQKSRVDLVFEIGPAADRDFGLRFTQLERRVDVLAECVDELDAALLTVGIDRAEREALNVKVGDDSSATVADLMDWAKSFPEQEARPLIQQAGVRGAKLLPARLSALTDSVEMFGRLVDGSAGGQHHSSGYRALHHPRVRVAVKKLVRELRAAHDEARSAAHV